MVPGEVDERGESGAPRPGEKLQRRSTISDKSPGAAAKLRIELSVVVSAIEL
jgi:hypothetical protein